MARTTPVHTGYTIINGSGTGINGYRIQVWAEYAFGEPDLQNNTVPLSLYFYTALDPAYTSSTRGTGLDSSLKVGATQVDSVKNGAYDFSSASNLHLLGSYNHDISYGSDGTGTAVISGSFTTVSSYISGGSIQATLTLPPIARQSSLGATDALIGQVSVIALSVPNPAYTHSIACTFGRLQGYIDQQGQFVEEETILTGQSFFFQVPTTFYRQIPRAQSGVCTLTCRTYLDGELVGQPQETTFTASVHPELCKPILSAVLEDTSEYTIALTGNPKRLVRNESLVKCTVSATPRAEAYLTGIKLNGVTLNSQEVMLGAPGYGDIVLEATDSRGFVTRYVAKPEGWVEYQRVTNLASVRRDAPTSDSATVTLTGNFWNENFGNADNQLSLQYRLGQEDWQDAAVEWTLADGRYEGAFVLTGLDYTLSHAVQIRVKDVLSQADKLLTVQRGIPVFDWGKEDFCFNVPVSAPCLNSPEIREMMTRIKNLEEIINGSN
ncbi:MAG: hypothetical protein IKW10_06765 [Oscillospiraceae bacterium]|nr:hypothetical protein [Oscillospiraceae bacterium]